MTRIVYLNGRYLEESRAQVSVFDRGFLFADAVYEVTAVLGGKLIDFAGHVARLQRSCAELGLSLPVSEQQLRDIHQELLIRNQLHEGGIYLQLTRGSAGDRDFCAPADLPPTLLLFTQARPLKDAPQASHGIHVVSLPDIRWHRRDIKTVQLLAPCLAKELAHARGADDAWLVEEGFVTEGSSSNAYIVTADGTVVTRPLSNDILHGITRQALMQLAAEGGIQVEERAFTVAEALAAKEAFISSATTIVWPVVSIDGQTIGDGKPGPVSLRLRQRYLALAEQASQG